jgi:Tol biopolymer transport system component
MSLSKLLMKNRFLSLILVFAFVISSCSIEINQPTFVTPSSPLGATPIVISSPASTLGPNTVTKTQIPITWAPLNLSARLVYIIGTLVDNVPSLQIQILNLVTGEVTTIFDVPEDSRLYYITVSPDNTQLLMSYSPSPGGKRVAQGIYIMPLDGSRPPRLLFTPPTKEDDYTEVEWSPDGKYIYFTHVNFDIPLEPGQVYPLYEIYRMAFPDGQPEKIVEKAYWPRLSSDSASLVYVSVDLFSLQNKLYVANADGRNAREVVLTSPLPPDFKDAPIFSADGQSIIFSAPVSAQSYQPNWVDKLMGVRIAKAHSNLTSDWWSVPVSGGSITQLTNIQSSNLFASFAPDNKHIASHSSDGIFVMNPDGSEVTMLIPNPQAVPGTIRWIP